MRGIDRMPISILFLIVCISVVVFAGFYRLCGHFGEGPVDASGPVSFWNCLYFSVVTFTSLGYGDILPKGISKALASLEVILGLAYLGVFIAKLSSSKQSYHLAQLYARDAQERLDDYALLLDEQRRATKQIFELMKRGEKLPRSLSKTQVDLYRTILRIRAYISFEISHGDLLLETPIGAPARLLKRLWQLTSVIREIACFPKTLHSQKQRAIAARTMAEIQSIALLMKNNSTDISIGWQARNTLEGCEKALAGINTCSKEVAEKFNKPLPEPLF